MSEEEERAVNDILKNGGDDDANNVNASIHSGKINTLVLLLNPSGKNMKIIILIR
jgi:hypothetical protein